MKKIRVFAMLTLIMMTGLQTLQAGWLDKLKQIATPAMQTGLDETQVGQALRQALELGIDKAVASASSEDGFLKNEDIKIPFPPKLKLMETTLRKVGMGATVDNFEEKMNRAAEAAAPEAKDILLNALFAMSIQDARGILSGGDHAATEYFKEKTQGALHDAFAPYLKKSMNQFQVVQLYDQLLARYEKIPFATKPELQSVEDYGTRKTIEGLFHLIGEQEQQIRTNPEARVTELLQKVFSS